MIKAFSLFLVITTTLVLPLQESCRSGKNSSCFKGRLEIKGICSNYTIRLLEGIMDTALVASAWTDETTGKSYTNVFGLGSPCTFPETIKEGGEFYFKLDTSTVQDCNVCLAYYPTPAKKLSIKVLKANCE